MYYKSVVEIPEVPGKITIRKGTYAMYETGRTYNPEKKYNVPNRVTIGKIYKSEKGKMYPNEKYNAYFPEAKIPESDSRPERSSCLRF